MEGLSPEPVPRVSIIEDANDAVLPPLVKGYVRLGSYVCGEPAWDPHFNTADLFMFLSMSKMTARYARHFLGR